MLLPATFVMALIVFMEATSISRALAAQRREKLNANQELVGQGLANIVGSFFQSYTVSGSFSRSAVAARSGAQSGLFAIVSALTRPPKGGPPARRPAVTLQVPLRPIYGSIRPANHDSAFIQPLSLSP